MSRAGTNPERGAALLTVLMIVAVMSTLALGLSQAVLASTERARLLDTQAQLRLYAAAAEEVAQSQLTQLIAETQGRLSSDLPGFGEARVFPVEGGSVRVQVRDLTNCFNLNAVAVDAAVSDETAQQTETLAVILEEGGVAESDARALEAALGDWIDDDRISRPSGAEDAYYLGLSVPYRTSSQSLMNMSEMLAIRGFERALLEDFKSVLCALPEHTLNPKPRLNLNTLRVDQASRLRWALSGALEINEVRSLIEARPIGGWTDTESFLEEPVVQRVAPEQRQLDRLSVVSSLIETVIEVSYRDDVVRIKVLFELESGQPVRVLRRERVS
ncbi:MAG: type II secretion system minor pseudopilin GspK [Pseudomonadota bacterium]